VLSGIGVGLALITGWLEGELVGRIGGGVDEGGHLNAPNSLSNQPARDQATTRSSDMPRPHAFNRLSLLGVPTEAAWVIGTVSLLGVTYATHCSVGLFRRHLFQPGDATCFRRVQANQVWRANTCLWRVGEKTAAIGKPSKCWSLIPP